jgi:hypothetical protein
MTTIEFETITLKAPVARCADGNGTLTPLFFSDHVIDIARAKAICAKCSLRVECLAGALEREEPWGVWRVIIANSNLPLIIVDTKDIAAFDGEIIERPEEYSAGVEHVKRSGTGIQQLDLMANSYLVTLQRLPNGTLELDATQLRRG